MPTPLDHNPSNGVTGGLWRAGGAVHKLLTCRPGVPAHCLHHATAAEHLDYGRGSTVDADARYAARAAGLRLCARWADEALELAGELIPTRSSRAACS